jgi:transposase-like protein
LLTHDVGVSATPQRRQFTIAYKKEILRAAERCTGPGEISALLRREGLYSSHLATWRKAEREGHLAGAPGAARRRGPAPDAPEVRATKAASRDAETAAAKRIAELERELKRAKARAERAEALVEAQKKVASLLDHLLPARDDEENSGNTGKR